MQFFRGTFYEIRRIRAICLRIFLGARRVVVGLMIMSASDKAELDVGQCTEIALGKEMIEKHQLGDCELSESLKTSTLGELDINSGGNDQR